MTVLDDPGRPGGRRVVADDGTLVARFLAGTRDGRPLADLLELAPGVPTARAVPALLSGLRGMRVCGDETVGAALVAAGGRPARHAHVYSRALRAGDPPPEPAPAPPGVEVAPAGRPLDDLVEAMASAFPPEHPDFRATPRPPDFGADITRYLSELGPLLECSRLAIDTDGRVLGGVLAVAIPGEPPLGGPWIVELFRHRERAPAGTGRVLLEHALARAARDGLPALGLAVTHGNRAEGLYRALGFARVLSSRCVDL